MTSREMTDVAIRMFQTLGWTMLRLCAVPSLFCLASVGFIMDYLVPHLGTTTKADWVGQVGELAGAILIGIVIGGPLYLIGTSSVSALVSQIVSDYLSGNVPEEETAKRALRTNLPGLMGLAWRELLLSLSGLIFAVVLLIGSAWLNRQGSGDVLTGLVAASSILAFLVGGCVFLYVRDRHVLASVIMVIEGANAKQSAKRSHLLRKGPKSEALISQTFSLIFLTFIALIGFASVYEILGLEQLRKSIFEGFPYPQIWMTAFDLLPTYLIIWFVLPVWSTLVTLFYFDRRIRLEGYDIDALAGDIWRADQVGRFQL